MQGQVESLKTLTLACWETEELVIDALSRLAEWSGLVQLPFPAPSQYQILLDCIQDDAYLVKELEKIYGPEKTERGRDYMSSVSLPHRGCLSDASMADSAQAMEDLQVSMGKMHNLLDQIEGLIGLHQADEGIEGFGIDEVAMIDCLLENAPILDSIVNKVTTSLLSLSQSEIDGLVVAARMLHVDYGELR